MDKRTPKRVILTRSAGDIKRDRGLFERFGFEVVPLPLIETEPLEFELPEEAIDYVVFQSAKAVRHYLDRADIPGGAKVVAVGEKTRRALEQRGYEVWLVPKDMSAEGVLEEFPTGRGEVVLIPRSEQGRTELIEGLKGKGYRVIPLNVYRTVNPKHGKGKVLEALKGGGFVVFASPSAVRGLFANLPKELAKATLRDLIVVAIGKTTKEELEKSGIKPKIIPMIPLMEEVAGKIHEFWQENCLI
ncbi:uroporphyrinogen-III synthase [Hydrogenivirga sp.]